MRAAACGAPIATTSKKEQPLPRTLRAVGDELLRTASSRDCRHTEARRRHPSHGTGGESPAAFARLTYRRVNRTHNGGTPTDGRSTASDQAAPLLDEYVSTILSRNGWLRTGNLARRTARGCDLTRPAGPHVQGAVIPGRSAVCRNTAWVGNALAVVNRRNADDPAGFYPVLPLDRLPVSRIPTPVVERILPRRRPTELASAADASAPRWPVTGHARTVGTLPARCSTSGSSATCRAQYLRAVYSTPRWPTGWAKRPGVCALEELRSFAGRWSSTAILYACDLRLPQIQGETSSKHRSTG